MKSPLQRHRRDGQRRHMHHSLSSSSRGLSRQCFCARLWTNWLFVSVATVCMSYFDADDTGGVETLSLLSFECLQYCHFDKCLRAKPAERPSFSQQEKQNKTKPKLSKFFHYTFKLKRKITLRWLCVVSYHGLSPEAAWGFMQDSAENWMWIIF